jgi:hypothetical protein
MIEMREPLVQMRTPRTVFGSRVSFKEENISSRRLLLSWAGNSAE